MTKRNQDFTIQSGDSVTIETTVTDAESGSAKDISGFNAQVTLATYEGGSVVEQYDDSDSRFDITDGLNGVCEATFDGADTETLSKHGTNDYYYEIEFTDTTGVDHTVTTGTITVKSSY